MKLAYYTHGQALKKFNEAKSMQEKRDIATKYFQLDAAIVNEEMRKALEGGQA